MFQQLELAAVLKLAPQLFAIADFGLPIAEFALDTQSQPYGLRARCAQAMDVGEPQAGIDQAPGAI
ncbi:MAG: hypothetical protein HZC22_09815, partial [Rhodocyclales bacterium]|nr:hypothetical protein [Rhodocyclales bacterium]